MVCEAIFPEKLHLVEFSVLSCWVVSSADVIYITTVLATSKTERKSTECIFYYYRKAVVVPTLDVDVSLF